MDKLVGKLSDKFDNLVSFTVALVRVSTELTSPTTDDKGGPIPRVCRM